MTRFARAVGSKSCNMKVPDDSTPWNELKFNQSNTESTKKIQWKKKDSDSLTEFKKSDSFSDSSASDISKSKSNFKHPVSNHEKVTKKINWKLQSCDSSNSECEDSLVSNELGLQKEKNKSDYKRRKPLTDIPSIYKDGTEISIVRYDGFPVKKEDADRLKTLKKKLVASKISRDQIRATMKLERRKAEKALAREKKKLCFHCRNSGHVLSECPQLDYEDRVPESGICFKCGSTEHQHTQCKIRGDVYKYATCFICKKEGHISKQCPDNPRGLYPEGGCCRLCGDVTHLKKDCLKFRKRKKDDFEITLNTLNSRDLDALDEDFLQNSSEIPSPSKKPKLIKI